MTAFATLPDGTRRRWHPFPRFEECSAADCDRAHATTAELLAPDPDADRARMFDLGWEFDKDAA